MEDNELNKKVIEKVRNKIVISNLESEENMKLDKRKQIVSLAVVAIVIFAGSFLSVNAATNGELVEKVKDSIKVVLIREDGKEEQLKGNTYTDSNNHIIEEYKAKGDNGEYSLKLDKTIMGKDNLDFEGSIKEKENEMSIIVKNK